MNEYFERVADELHRLVDHQSDVVRRCLCPEGSDGKGPVYCPLVECPRIDRLTAAIRETIAVIEATRGSFKSKRLEVLRRKLTDILTGA